MEVNHTGAGRSPLQSLDARTRIIGVVIYSVVVAFLRTPSALGLALGLATVFVLLAQPPAAVLLRRLLAFNLFLAFLWVFIPWGMPGEEIFGIGSLSVTREGSAT